MGATSVTGVGIGSAEGNQRGGEAMSLGVHKLIGPHVCRCGTETLSGTTAVIEFPELPGVVGDYSVFLTNNSSTTPYISTAMAAISSTDMWGLTVTAGNNDVVKWMVVKNGF